MQNMTLLLAGVAVAMGLLTGVAEYVQNPPTYAQTETDRSITFVQHSDETTALKALQNDMFDIYYYSIPADQIGESPPDGVRMYDSVGSTTHDLYVNPADNTEQFNPFAYREVRYSLNFLVDRDDIVSTILDGRGIAMISSVEPRSKNYLLVNDQLDALGISYDPQRADMMISKVLQAEGAMKVNGTWLVDDEPIVVKIFIRTDDPVRDRIGHNLVAELEKLGFVVDVMTGSLQDAFDMVFATDPAQLEWHIYTSAFSGLPIIKYDDSSIGQMYAPWASSMPGQNNPNYWNYENSYIDNLTLRLAKGDYTNAEERANLIRQATIEGVQEAVRIFLVSEGDRYVVDDGVMGVVNAQGYGITNRATLINVSSYDEDVTIGVKYIMQSAINPVGGIVDAYSSDIMSIVRDPSINRDPFTGEWLPVRNSWKVETMGPDGKIEMSDDAVRWNSTSQQWDRVEPDAKATSKVTIDLELSNWHNGVPIDINDIMYPAYFQAEWSSNDGEGDKKYSKELADSAIKILQGLHVVDDDTIDVYINYWHSDSAEIASHAGLWSNIPWEIYAAMEEIVGNGNAAFSNSEAKSNNVPWLSLMERDHADLIKTILEGYASDGTVPAGLYVQPTDVDERYQASIKWIADKGNAMISNGPFYIDSYERLSDGAWITYSFLNPATGKDQSKMSWVVQRDNYIFGSGFYLEGEEAQSIGAEWTIAKAIATYNQMGTTDAFAAITGIESTTEDYPFVSDKDWNIVAHGANPALVGSNIDDLIEANRSLDGVLAELDARGTATIIYEFVNPATGLVEPKYGLLELHDGYIFGSGYYTSHAHVTEHYLQADDAITSTNNALALYDEHGDGAFEIITTLNVEEDTYPFVITADTALEIADGSILDRRGQTVWNPIEVEAALGGVRDEMIVKGFDDSTYPFEPDHLRHLAEDTDSLSGVITIGALAPTTGGASSYGTEISEASKLAAIHFNEHLEKIGASWSLSVDRHDTETNPTVAKEKLSTLNAAGIKIVDGHAIDYDSQVLEFARDNEMLLVSCCSVTTQLAHDDLMFRIAPGHEHHAERLAEIMDEDGIDVIVPVGLDVTWINDLLDLTSISFTNIDTANSAVPRINYSDDLAVTAEQLAASVREQLNSTDGDKVAVLFTGFERNVEFIKMASQHEILDDVRWYGAELNTVRPNVLDDATAKAFANRVSLTAVQPTTQDSIKTQQIREHFAANTDFYRQPSVYTNYEYDVVWLIGLSILDAQSTDVNAVKDALIQVSSQYVGASGNTVLDMNGDRTKGQYATWKVDGDQWVEIIEVGVLVPINREDGAGVHRHIATEYGIDDFNEYLANKNAPWRLAADVRDSTSSEAVPSHMVSFNEKGINMVTGPSSSGKVGSIKDYADSNNMLVISCCSTAPTMSLEGDNIFRFAPDDTLHGPVIAELHNLAGKEVLISVWKDDPFGNGLHDSTVERFEELGGIIDDLGSYQLCEGDGCYDSTFEEMTQQLAEKVQKHVDARGNNKVSVLYVGAGETEAFMEKAADHPILHTVSWTGSDANIQSPALVNNPKVFEFLTNANFRSCIFDADTTGEVYNDLSMRLSMDPRIVGTPNAYAYSSYDTVWVIGLAMENANGAGFDEIKRQIPLVTEEYRGALGKIELNAAGDSTEASYAVWGIEPNGWERIGTYIPGYGLVHSSPTTIEVYTYSDNNADGTKGVDESAISNVTIYVYEYDTGKLSTLKTGPDGMAVKSDITSDTWVAFAVPSAPAYITEPTMFTVGDIQVDYPGVLYVKDNPETMYHMQVGIAPGP